MGSRQARKLGDRREESIKGRQRIWIGEKWEGGGGERSGWTIGTLVVLN